MNKSVFLIGVVVGLIVGSVLIFFTSRMTEHPVCSQYGTVH